jgi:phosphonate transport system substrate-binding protein
VLKIILIGVKKMTINKKGFWGISGGLLALTGMALSGLGSMQIAIANPLKNQPAPRLVAQKMNPLTIGVRDTC